VKTNNNNFFAELELGITAPKTKRRFYWSLWFYNSDIDIRISGLNYPRSNIRNGDRCASPDNVKISND
jgi:hypothetical protein